jgi:hypothetical protein
LLKEEERGGRYDRWIGARLAIRKIIAVESDFSEEHLARLLKDNVAKGIVARAIVDKCHATNLRSGRLEKHDGKETGESCQVIRAHIVANVNLLALLVIT